MDFREGSVERYGDPPEPSGRSDASGRQDADRADHGNGSRYLYIVRVEASGWIGETLAPARA